MRKPLGRGLGALIAGVPVESGDLATSAYINVPLDQIVPSPFQPRRHFDPERLGELAEAIRVQGVIEPLVVRCLPENGLAGARYELIAGERRLRAAREAGLETVPVIVRDLDDRTALEVSLVENLAREDLNAVDEARALACLAREFALSHEQIAGRIGKSRPYVSNAMRLLDLPEPVLEMVERGELSSGQVRPLLSMESAGAQLAAAKQIVAERISARGVEAMASHRRSSKPGATTHADVHLQALVDTLQRALKRKVRVVRQRGKMPGRVEIEYYNDEDLTALATILSGHSHSHTGASPL